ncbi:DUF6763 family protein [Thiohalomonas denitrificans]|uniref:Uncharacterized protein n=1 Tax=Thiohalomonas denitrificans TaxID=415747 RepID=A0A1G5QR77_9GAMM|nr:DUF6763 family protein [Thiohalomonas denitrificans]SCZ64343.1 hypothetical protein SAMN03097708_02613 [Thiohalomonas denitrificans]
MPSDLDPIVGNWYRDKVEKSQRFEVVSLEEDAGTVEIQHFDGNVEEWDLEEWYLMDLESIEPPEDWTGPMDEETRGDLVYMDSDMKPEEWEEPYQEAHERTRGPDEEYRGDEWADKDLGKEEE